ncbi:MAG: DUF4197 domain-containing protein [Geobacteraceae bacterium]|nr:DUF4197 domain-containing protein [Geobacteraceae bacterium]
MKSLHRSILAATLLLTTISSPVHAGFFDDLTSVLGGAGGSPGGNLDDPTIAKGLKEALATGTTRAITSVSRQDGYFGNEMIKILMPEKIRSTADLLGRVGFQQEVDDFVLSMNRAAEKAAPKATEHFTTALKAMSFDDARAILQGDTTSATRYFRQKTGDRIYADFKPVVVANMKDVGVSRNFMQLKEKFDAIPFSGTFGTFDLDHYVTTKAVDGLFSMLGEEERKIRTDPAARGTELLKKVFGK